MSTSVDTGLNPFNFITLSAQRLSERTVEPVFFLRNAISYPGICVWYTVQLYWL
jgi:hypothetical protein